LRSGDQNRFRTTYTRAVSHKWVLLSNPVQESLVVLGEMSLRGGLQPLGSLTERLQLAMDNGARRVLLPLENKRDFLDIPGDVLDKLQIIFYSEPLNAAFRAMGLE
jgi:ATP-dependent Lon protease